MKHKKLIAVGLVIIIALWLITSLQNSFVGSSSTIQINKNNSTQGSSYGFSSTPSFDLGTRNSSEISVPTVNQPAMPATDAERKVIQNASISMVVSDVEQSTKEIEQLAKAQAGFVASSSQNSYNSNKKITSANMQVRVPQPQLNSFLESLKTRSIQVTNLSVNTDDVTTQVRDLQAELDNLKKQEEQLRSFYEKTNNITQLLEVERELTRVRTQIDQTQGQLNYYNRASELSTVVINLALDQSELPATPTDRFTPLAVWNAAIASMLGMLQSLAYLGIYLVVYSIIWIPALIGFILFKKYRKRSVQK